MCSGRDILTNRNQRISLADDFADAAGNTPVTLESRNGGIRGVVSNCNQQTAGRLWIKEKVAVFLRDAFGKTDASANEIAIILQAAWNEPFAYCFESAGKV